MRVPWRRAARMGVSRPVSLTLAVAGFATAMLVLPAVSGASGSADRLAGTPRKALPPGGPTSSNKTFDGVAAVGTLFGADPKTGKLGNHFCTASVVHSPGGDLAVTAGHCATQHSGPVVFVPGYDDGRARYGQWRVTRTYTPPRWQAMQDPDDDVAFLRIAPAPNGVPIEDVTGAERLGANLPSHTYVQVMGYPDAQDKPVWCANWTDRFSPTQLEFHCAGYTIGTSGSPFLADVSPSTGEGTVIGVIGGYEQGGDTASVSYSVAFDSSVESLYRTAAAGG